MRILETHTLNSDQQNKICRLWNNEYPKDLSYNSSIDFDSYLNNLINQQHYILLNDDEEIIGWSVEFEREEEKWFAIIINSDFQNKGFGRKLLEKLKQNNIKLNGWVIDHNKQLRSNGDYYKTPIEFYLKHQFSIQTNTRMENEKISAVKIVWTKNSNS